MPRTRFLCLGLFALAACGDDDASGSVDGSVDGMVDAVVDASVDASVPDAAPDATPDADATVRPPGSHMSYVAPGQAPETAARLVVFGDSISAGVGASQGLEYSLLLAANEDGVYPDDAAADLESLTGAAVERVDIAVSGARTANLAGQLQRLQNELTFPAAGHTVVVGTIGGNDVAGLVAGGDPAGAPLDDALANIRGFVGFFQDPANFPDGTSIYLANVYDPSDGVGQHPSCFFGLPLSRLTDALPVWSMRYVELGTELGFSVVDILGFFRGHGYYFDDMMNEFYDMDDPTFWWAGGGDCLHPNDRGHHEMRRVFFEAMDPTYVAN
ncbi:MAG: SGNH/GDSL hydrolase family protein [Myxococcota bacterium]